jgi:hypothetical protein
MFINCLIDDTSKNNNANLHQVAKSFQEIALASHNIEASTQAQLTIMTQRLILHIGQPKTGTTTLQKTLQASRSALLNAGIFHPNTGKDPNHKVLLPHLTGCHLACITPASRSLKIDPRKIMLESKERWSDFLADNNNYKPNTIILSSEQLFRVKTKDDLESLTNHLKPLASEIIFTAYLREPASSMLSGAQQLLKSQPDFKLRHKNTFRRVLEPYIKSGLGKMSLRVFDRKSLEGGDIVNDFFTHYIPNFDQQRLSHCKDANTSMSAEAMALMQEINRKERPASSTKVLKRIIASVDGKVEGYSRPRMHDHVRHAIRSRCTDLNWLEDQFGIIFQSNDATAMSANKADEICEALDRVHDICEIDVDRKEALWITACNDLNSKRPISRLIRRLFRAN